MDSSSPRMWMVLYRYYSSDATTMAVSSSPLGGDCTTGESCPAPACLPLLGLLLVTMCACLSACGRWYSG